MHPQKIHKFTKKEIPTLDIVYQIIAGFAMYDTKIAI